MVVPLAVSFGGPALPLGFDLGLPDDHDDHLDDEIKNRHHNGVSVGHGHEPALSHNHNHYHSHIVYDPHQLIQAMTVDPAYYHAIAGGYRSQTPPGPLSHRPEISSSGDRLTLIPSTGTSPYSPTSSSILTPSSTIPEHSGDVTTAVVAASATAVANPTTSIDTFDVDLGDSDALTSPFSAVSQFTDDFVYVFPPSQEGADSSSSSFASGRRPAPASSSAGSGRGSAVAPSSHLSRESSLALSDAAAAIHQPWHSFASTTTTSGTWMDQHHHYESGSDERGGDGDYDTIVAATSAQPPSHVMPTTARQFPYQMADVTAIPQPFGQAYEQGVTSQPVYRPVDATGHQLYSADPFTTVSHDTSSLLSYSHDSFSSFEAYPQDAFRMGSYPYDPNVAFPEQTQVNQSIHWNPFQDQIQGPAYHSGFVPAPGSHHSTSHQSDDSSPHINDSPTPQRLLRPPTDRSRAQVQRTGRTASSSATSHSSLSASPSRRQPPASVPPPPSVAGSSRHQHDPEASSAQGQRRGGRQRNSRLPDHTRQKTSRMRKAGACWRCVLQRDPVNSFHPSI